MPLIPSFSDLSMAWLLASAATQAQSSASDGPGWGMVVATGLIGIVLGFAAARLVGNRSSSGAPDSTVSSAGRRRAWDKRTSESPVPGAPPPANEGNRSWHAPSAAPPLDPPADPDDEPPVPDAGEADPPPAPRNGKRRGWER